MKNRIFVHLNHHKTMNPETVKQHTFRIRRTLLSLTKNEDTVYSIVPSRIDRAAFGGSDWDAWSSSVTRRYAMCIELDINVGRATADVVSKMLRVGKPVYLYLDRGDNVGFLQRVIEVVTINQNDWQNGWALRIKE